jgi:chromosome segregation ATPase
METNLSEKQSLLEEKEKEIADLKEKVEKLTLAESAAEKKVEEPVASDEEPGVESNEVAEVPQADINETAPTETSQALEESKLRIEELNNEIQALKETAATQLEEHRVEVAELLETRSKLESKLETNISSIEQEKQSQIEELKQQLQESQKEASDLRSEVDTLRGEIQEMHVAQQNRVAELTKQLNEQHTAQLEEINNNHASEIEKVRSDALALDDQKKANEASAIEVKHGAYGIYGI